MTKDLSRQLCELAGIKAKHLFSDISDNFEDGFTAFSDILEADLSNGSWMQITKEPVYPNFKLPENFVKLLECLFQFPFNCEEKETYMESILYGTIEKLKNEECGELKQALQATEFRY